MTKPSPLAGEAYAVMARRFAVLAESTHLQLLHALIDEEKNVTEMVELTRGTLANVSRHLQTLAQANLLTRRKAGRRSFRPSVTPPSCQRTGDAELGIRRPVTCRCVSMKVAITSSRFSDKPRFVLLAAPSVIRGRQECNREAHSSVAPAMASGSDKVCLR